MDRFYDANHEVVNQINDERYFYFHYNEKYNFDLEKRAKKSHVINPRSLRAKYEIIRPLAHDLENYPSTPN